MPDNIVGCYVALLVRSITLVRDGLVEADFAPRKSDNQIAISNQTRLGTRGTGFVRCRLPSAEGRLFCWPIRQNQPDLPGVGSRRHHGIVFQLPLVAVIG